jgi:RNA polymerase sigma factor (sigma-70 family)
MDQSSQAGDAAAVERLTPTSPLDEGRLFLVCIEPALPGAYRLATLILDDRAAAEDVVGDAVERAWRGWPGLRDRNRFDGWFTRIVVNACRDHIRRRRRVVLVAIPESLAATEHGSDGLATRDAIGRAFEQLDVDERAVVALRLEVGLTLDEVAARLGIPIGTVKSRLHRALNRMRMELQRAEP